jgi:hypothetical protein
MERNLRNIRFTPLTGLYGIVFYPCCLNARCGTAAQNEETAMTKTNIDLIVNGAKVYTRKTTGRPYTHALVVGYADKVAGVTRWTITSCSSKGPDSLQKKISEGREYAALVMQEIKNGAEAKARAWGYSNPTKQQIADAQRALDARQQHMLDWGNTTEMVVPIINNTVMVTA